MTIEDMLAREAIRYTIELYNRNIDTGDFDRHAEVFHPDAHFVVRGLGEAHGLDAILKLLRPGASTLDARDPGNFQRHNLTSMMIDLTGADTADVTTYICVTSEKGFDHCGRYDDKFVRADDRWLILKRHAAMEWSRDDSRFARWLGDAKPMRRWPW
jgi:ketosteroid isomerase-like protein